MNDTLMIHSISTSTKNNAAKFSHNSLQGHYHSIFEISYAADSENIRWSMTVGTLQDPHGVAARYGSGIILKRPILGIGVVLGREDNYLVISDLHIPYHHRDSFDFLECVYNYYQCTRVLNVGDLIDHHAGSYHESEPDALSPEQEYLDSKKYAQELQHIFPEMIIAEGNHDKIPKRKLVTSGLPASMVHDYNALYDLKDTWKWKDRYLFNSKGGTPVLVPMVLNSRGRWDKRVHGEVMR